MKNSTWWIFILFLSLVVNASLAEAEESPTFLALKGKVTFKRYCSNCHGVDAKGGGDIAKYLKIPPADLTKIQPGDDGEFPFDEVQGKIDGRQKVPGHGMREMPIWGDVFQTLPQLTPTDEAGEERAQRKIRELLLYLESIQE